MMEYKNERDYERKISEKANNILLISSAVITLLLLTIVLNLLK